MAKDKSAVGIYGGIRLFSCSCYVLSLYVAVKHGFDVIHAHNPPDTLFLVAALYKPFGKKFIFDHHDLSAELYQSRSDEQRVHYQVLLCLEKCNLKIADLTIATNESYRQIQIERGKVKSQNVYVVRNGPNLNRLIQLPPNERLRSITNVFYVILVVSIHRMALTIFTISSAFGLQTSSKRLLLHHHREWRFS